MIQPVLSIDVSKSTSYAAAFYSYGKPYKKPMSVRNTPEGIGQLLEWLEDLRTKTDHHPQVVLEATGNYSKPIKHFFQNAGYDVVELNPLETHQQKRKSIRKIKTDPVDTNRIAKVYYLSEHKVQYRFSDIAAKLRSLCRQYNGINNLYREAQLQLQSTIDLLFPRFCTVFSNTCGLTLKVISAFPTPESILDASKSELAFLLKAGNQSDAWVDQKIEKLKTVASESLFYRMGQHANIQALKAYVEILSTHKRILTDLRKEISKIAKQSPVYHLLITIPGVGNLTAATLIGEIGDVERFPTVKQLIAYAGLDPTVFQSGKFTASKNKISKRGTPLIRRALYQAVFVAIRKFKDKPNNPILYEYYSRKVAEGKPKKVALIATCNKLLKICYGIWKHKELFHRN